MAYIEYKGNQIQQFEQAKLQEDIEKGRVPNIPQFKLKILKQEREMFLKLIEESTETKRVK